VQASPTRSTARQPRCKSALLEAMEERQVSVGRASYALPALFMVMTMQDPIEQDGTYALPESQLDRFLLHVEVGYPAPEVEPTTS
jgi:MoxR-like ATPase